MSETETNIGPVESNENQSNGNPSPEETKKPKSKVKAVSTLDALTEAFNEAKTEDRKQEVLKAIKAHKDAAELAAKVLG